MANMAPSSSSRTLGVNSAASPASVVEDPVGGGVELGVAQGGPGAFALPCIGEQQQGTFGGGAHHQRPGQHDAVLLVQEMRRGVDRAVGGHEVSEFGTQRVAALGIDLFVRGPRRPELHHRHAVLGQRARLVAADVGGVAHGFAGGQHADETLIFVHLARAVGQRDRDSEG
eukprot:scaffold888_cov246-Pinguiococcus_pyrenoidosus.AAC.15